MIEAIYQRASVRKFTDEAVSDQQIREILRAAMAAPSAGNQQPWEFYVVRNDKLRTKLSEVTPYAKPALSASCVIVPCMRTEGLRFPGLRTQDTSAAVENLLLAVVDEGLGAVWMGIAPEADRMAAVAEIIEAPAGLEPFALIACGHPEAEANPKGAERFDESRIHWLG